MDVFLVMEPALAFLLAVVDIAKKFLVKTGVIALAEWFLNTLIYHLFFDLKFINAFQIVILLIAGNNENLIDRLELAGHFVKEKSDLAPTHELDW